MDTSERLLRVCEGKLNSELSGPASGSVRQRQARTGSQWQARSPNTRGPDSWAAQAKFNFT
eukprot:10019913-Alexandrium_andersonii.AAC.1